MIRNHKIENDKLYITAGNNLLTYDFKNDKLEVKIFKALDYKWLMGVTSDSDGNLFIGGNNCIIDIQTNEAFIVPSSQINLALHHIKCIDNKIIAPATTTNQLIILNLDLKLESIVNITPPNKTKQTINKLNYNHLNGVHYHNGHYYVDLNWYTTTQFSFSGVAVLDENFEEIDRFLYGWQSHGFCIIDNKKYVLCGLNKRNKEVHHPNIGGLMVDDEIVYEIDDSWFCKNFSVDDDYIYIVGGNCSIREERNNTNGLLVILDRDFNEVSRIVFNNTGEFRGCLLNNYDLSDT